MQSSAQRQSSVEIVEFSELGQYAELLPEDRRESFRLALDKATKKARLLTSIVQMLREMLAQLRLDATYLIFDRDATRRERDQVQQRLDDVTKRR